MMPGVSGRANARRAWRFDATVEAPGSARAAVRAFVECKALDTAELDAMVLCVSEAVTNAVLHAYDGQAPGDVELEAGLFDEHLDLVVRDHGKGLAPRSDSPGFGIGLPLISQMASSAEVHTHEAGGTEITMRFQL